MSQWIQKDLKWLNMPMEDVKYIKRIDLCGICVSPCLPWKEAFMEVVHTDAKNIIIKLLQHWPLPGLSKTFFYKFSFAWKSAYNLNEMACFRTQAACLPFEAKWTWISIRCSHYDLSPPVVFIKIVGKCDIIYDDQDLYSNSSVPIILAKKKKKKA